MVKSTKARKQRKALYNAPNHIKRRMVASHLSRDLIQEYGRRSMPVIRGDTVVVVRGEESILGIEGRVQGVDTNTGRITVEGVTIAKADGTQVARPVHASNLEISKMDLSDDWRREKLQRSKEGSQ